jgi:hypothetical protein
MERNIHQIWLSKEQPPEPYMETVEQFALRYGYHYFIWTPAHLKARKKSNSLTEIIAPYGGWVISPYVEVINGPELDRFLSSTSSSQIYMTLETCLQDAESKIIKLHQQKQFSSDDVLMSKLAKSIQEKKYKLAAGYGFMLENYTPESLKLWSEALKQCGLVESASMLTQRSVQ